MGEIAAYYGISFEHLRKVVHRMATLGYLKSTRGRCGGLLLGREAKRIRIGEVIVAMEGNLYAIDCDALQCVLLPGCSLRTALDRASRAFVATMNDVTLADLLADAGMKRQFKGLDIAVRAH